MVVPRQMSHLVYNYWKPRVSGFKSRAMFSAGTFHLTHKAPPLGSLLTVGFEVASACSSSLEACLPWQSLGSFEVRGRWEANLKAKAFFLGGRELQASVFFLPPVGKFWGAVEPADPFTVRFLLQNPDFPERKLDEL